MLEDEERWHMKRRAMWIKSSDKNTKYFHNFASHRRNKKHLWEILYDEGQSHLNQEAIKRQAKHHFSSFYKAPE
jgi:hypothetical protein